MFETTDHLQSLSSAFSAKRRWGWLWVVLVSVFTAAVTYVSFVMLDIDSFELQLAPLLIGATTIYAINRWVIKSQQSLVIPNLAQSIGLEYEQKPTAFLSGLPPRLLPRSDAKTIEDGIFGEMDGHNFKFAEVHVRVQNGQSVRSIFRGFVMQFENKTLMPSFYIAPEQHTDGRRPRMGTNGLVKVKTLESQNGELFGVWLSEQGLAKQDDALSMVLDVANKFETQLNPKAKLFSMTSNGEEMHVAFEFPQDLFRVGGLFANRGQTLDHLKNAMDDLNILLQVLAVLIEVEQSYAENRRIA